MIQDVVIEIRGKRIVFSCPACHSPDVFPAEMIKGITGKNVARKCTICNSMVAINKPKIEAALEREVSRNPGLENPLEDATSKKAADEIKIPPKLTGDYEEPIPEGDLILVLDYEESFREDVRVVFSDIANVKAHGASLGAVRFIKRYLGYITLIIMDVYLGDGTCFDVLERLSDNEEATKVPVIVVSSTKEDEKMIKESLSSYPQVKFVIQKEGLMKKLIELSTILARQKGTQKD